MKQKLFSRSMLSHVKQSHVNATLVCVKHKEYHRDIWGNTLKKIKGQE